MATVSVRMFVFSIVSNCALFALSLPVTQEFAPENVPAEILNATNGTKDLYIIKTIVYEVGILTDANNSSADTNTHEQVDLTFFDPVKNGSQIDLSNIPVPIQTNISGVTVTGIAPANLGTIQLPEHGEPATYSAPFPLNVPLFPNALISIKENISTVNDEKSAQLLANLPSLLHLTSPISGDPIKIEKVPEIKQNEGSKDSEEVSDSVNETVNRTVPEEDQ